MFIFLDESGDLGFDFSWGIFRKHERQDDEWYSFFSEWIIFEDEYLPRNTEDGP